MIEACPLCGELLAPAAARCDACGAPPDGDKVVSPAATALLSFMAGTTLTAGLCVIGAIVAAVTVPTTVQARAGHNEEAAVEALRALAAAQRRFHDEDLEGDGLADYGDLAELAAVGLIDADLASGVRQGYTFQAAPAATARTERWSAVASPLVDGRTGRRHLAVDHRGTVRFRYYRPIPLDARDAMLPADALPLGWGDTD